MKLLIQFGWRSCIILSLNSVPHANDKAKKICLNKTCSRVGVGNSLSDMFPIRNGLKQENVCRHFFSNFVFEYAIRRIRVNQDDLELNGKPRFLFHVDYVNLFGGRIHTIEKGTESVLVSSMEINI